MPGRCRDHRHGAGGGALRDGEDPLGAKGDFLDVHPGALVERTASLSTSWLRRRGYLDESQVEDACSKEAAAQTALEACAAIAMGRGTVATLVRQGDDEGAGHAAEPDPAKPALAVERYGFNVHAGVRVSAGDDLGRERLCRYGARPPMSLERLRRLPGGRVGYRLKYVDRGRKGKHRVMNAMEFMARLAAIIAPPRYPLVRYGGVLAPRSAWRKIVVPGPPERPAECPAERREESSRAATAADARTFRSDDRDVPDAATLDQVGWPFSGTEAGPVGATTGFDARSARRPFASHCDPRRRRADAPERPPRRSRGR